jgi:hypothetical protein
MMLAKYTRQKQSELTPDVTVSASSDAGIESEAIVGLNERSKMTVRTRKK